RALRAGPPSPANQPGGAGSRAWRTRQCSRADELAKLPAGGADVLALAPADRRRHARVHQDLLEGEDPRQRRTLERRRLPVVERNEVDLDPDPAQQARERARVVLPVVDAVQEHVLEKDALTRRQRITLHSGHERPEIP